MAVVARPQPAVEIRAGAGGRQEHEPARFVHRHWRPDVGVAFVGHRRAVPAQSFRFRGFPRDRIEGPAWHAGSCVECPHRPARSLHAQVVGDGGADNDDAAGDDRCGADLVLAGPFQRRLRVDDDFPARAEVFAAPAVREVDRDQAVVVGAGEDARCTRLVCRHAVIAPVGDAAADVTVGRPLLHVDQRIVAPEFGAGRRIERDDDIERGAENQLVLDQDRGHFELGALEGGRGRLRVARAIGPDRHEVLDGLGGDLDRRRVAQAAGVTAEVGPADGCSLAGAAPGDREQRDEAKRAPHVGHLTPRSDGDDSDLPPRTANRNGMRPHYLRAVGCRPCRPRP